MKMSSHTHKNKAAGVRASKNNRHQNLNCKIKVNGCLWGRERHGIPGAHRHSKTLLMFCFLI